MSTIDTIILLCTIKFLEMEHGKKEKNKTLDIQEYF